MIIRMVSPGSGQIDGITSLVSFISTIIFLKVRAFTDKSFVLD